MCSLWFSSNQSLLKDISFPSHFFFPEQCHAPGSSTDVLNVALTLSALSFCVRERLKSWSICLTAICLVWPVSARNIGKWLGNWFLCIMGCRTRRRWSAKMSALCSALFHVESSLEALSPLGAGCWYSYTHTLQQQSSPGWTAGNSLSWQNSAFWQGSLLQQCLPVPAEGAAAAEAHLWQHQCSVLLPLPA